MRKVCSRKIYRAWHYSLYNIKEIVELYNDECRDNDKITFYKMCEVIAQQKQILKVRHTRMTVDVKLVRMVGSSWKPLDHILGS